MTTQCPEVIGSLAFGLHMRRQEDLQVALPEGTDAEAIKGSYLFTVNDSVVSYASLAARNQCASQFVFSKNKVAFESNPTQWIQLAHKMWRCEITNEDKASGRLLSLVNQENDVFSLASEVINSGEIRAFDVLHVIESSLPYLEEISLDGLIHLCLVQHEHTKNDMMSGRFISELKPVLITRPDDCLALHERISETPLEETQGLYQVALSSLVKSSEDQGFDLLLQDSDSSSEFLKSAAIWTLGVLLSESQVPAFRRKEVEEVILRNISETIERVKTSAVRVSARCLKVTNAFDETLEELAESGNQVALCSIAESLFFDFKEMKGLPGFEKWMRLLSRVAPEYKGGIDNTDFVLSQTLEDSTCEQLVVEILTCWISQYGQLGVRDKSIVDLFDTTCHELIQRPELISEIITEWYLSSDNRLSAAATGLLAEMNLRKIKEVGFNSERLDSLDKDDLILLARRMLGYLSDEDHLFSLTNSLLNTADASERTFGLVLDLFVNALGEDYPGATIENLESAVESETDQKRIALYSNAVRQIKARVEQLDGLPRLQEFCPNNELEWAFQKARAKQMSLEMEKANKGSIVEMIATKIPIKAGKGWFSYRDGKYSEPSYLKPYSSEMSIPRRCVTDEVGQELQGILLRNTQKGNK